MKPENDNIDEALKEVICANESKRRFRIKVFLFFIKNTLMLSLFDLSNSVPTAEPQ